jgi:hypothetical protein
MKNIVLNWYYLNRKQSSGTPAKTFLRKCKILLDPYGGRKYIN